MEVFWGDFRVFCGKFEDTLASLRGYSWGDQWGSLEGTPGVIFFGHFGGTPGFFLGGILV